MTTNNPLEDGPAAINSPEEQGGETLARLMLNVLIEPGSPSAGQLIQRIGAEHTIRLLLGHETPSAELAEQAAALHAARRPGATEHHAALAVDSARQHGIRLLVPSDTDWPAALRDLGAIEPIALWTRGDTTLLAQPSARRVTMTGARAATGYGEHVTRELATALTERGIATVAGGAYGIDGTAHRATLDAGGNTIAVLAGGLDRPYPAGNADLLRRVGDRGLLVSEVPPGTAPTKWRFLQRARVLAAISDTTVVVEAGYRSGSLLIAERARELGRTVAAVPGPITSAASAGTHRLLRDHAARLVTDAHDLLPD